MPRRFYFGPVQRKGTRSGWEDFADAAHYGIDRGVQMAQTRQDFRGREQDQRLRGETHEANIFERGFRRPDNLGQDPIAGELAGPGAPQAPSFQPAPRREFQGGSIMDELAGGFPHAQSHPDQDFPVPDHQGMGTGHRDVVTAPPRQMGQGSLASYRPPEPQSMENALMGGGPPTFAREQFRVQGSRDPNAQPMNEDQDRRARLERVTENLLFDRDGTPQARQMQLQREERERALTDMRDTLTLTNPDLSKDQVERVMSIAQHNPGVLEELYARGLQDVYPEDDPTAQGKMGQANPGVVALIQTQFPDLSQEEAAALASALQETGQSLPSSLFQGQAGTQEAGRASWQGPQRFSEDWFDATDRFNREQTGAGGEGPGAAPGGQARLPGSLTRLQAQNIIEGRYIREAQGPTGQPQKLQSPQEIDRMAQELFETGTYEPAEFRPWAPGQGFADIEGALAGTDRREDRGGPRTWWGRRQDQSEAPPEVQLDTVRAAPPGQAQSPQARSMGSDDFDFDEAAAAEGFFSPSQQGPGEAPAPAGPPTQEQAATSLTGAYLDMYVEEVASVLSEVPPFMMDRATASIREQLLAEGMSEADADRVIQMARRGAATQPQER